LSGDPTVRSSPCHPAIEVDRDHRRAAITAA
jgi:hypothetical protein